MGFGLVEVAKVVVAHGVLDVNSTPANSVGT